MGIVERGRSRRWRAWWWQSIDLAAWVWDASGISVSEATLSRELKALGFPKLPARPSHHAQNEERIAAFEDFPARLAEVREALPPGTGIEFWFVDEARIVQKNKITRRGAKRGTRSSCPHGQRTQSAYSLGAICPTQGKGAHLVMLRCGTQAMTAHLAEISAAVEPGTHNVLILDRAGWHISKARSSSRITVPSCRCRRDLPS